MSPTGPNLPESLGDDPREQRLGELLNEFFDRRQAGEAVTHEKFLAENPDYAAELREHLGGLDLIQDLKSTGSETARLNTPPLGLGGSSADDGLKAAKPVLPQITGYQILKQIGRGGMGVVFKAVQLSTKRVVALKVLLEGPFATESARRRFEREIALAAQLRHPNIIPIYDSGEADGRMYYAMEHIFGMSLSDHLRAHQLDIRTRLKLFLQICAPVGHAHQRGVIHRDIKPTNVLVDGNGDPHVLDFGLARAGSLGDANASMTAQIVGTPAYMSPEQASGDPSGIDTRVDVYALGVTLYEMLTGRMPYDTNVSIGKLLHNIAHAEPTPPYKFVSRIDGDLSAIVLKSLEKKKEDRYQSVDALASDVSRYLADEPISAKPASGLYLLRKALFKHKFAVGSAAVLLVFGLAVTLIVRYFTAEVERKVAETRQRDAAIEELKEKISKKQTGIPENERRLQDEARAAYELAKSNLPPDLAQAVDSFAGAMATSIGRPEAAPKIGATFLASVLAELGPQSGASSIKQGPVDPTEPIASPRPEWAIPQEKSPELRDQIVRELEGVLAALKTAPAQASTSQPTSGPVATQPSAAPSAPTSSPTGTPAVTSGGGQ